MDKKLLIFFLYNNLFKNNIYKMVIKYEAGECNFKEYGDEYKKL